MHQGLEQDVVQNPGSTNAATTSTKTQDQRPSLEHKGSLGPPTSAVHVIWSRIPLVEEVRVVGEGQGERAQDGQGERAQDGHR
jgi:hypothetical protein